MRFDWVREIDILQFAKRLQISDLHLPVIFQIPSLFGKGHRYLQKD